MLGKRYEWLEFGFECFEYRWTGLNLHLNASNLVRVVRIGIRMLWMPVEWLEFAFECFESLSKVSNLHSNDSNPFQMVWIWIWMLWIHFEWVYGHLGPYVAVKCSLLVYRKSRAVYGSLGESSVNLWLCLREVYGSLGKSMESLQQSR